MKSKEELEILKQKVSEVNEKLPGLDKEGQKAAVSGLDKEMTELSEDELKEITAGTAFSAGNYSYVDYYHTNCGGMIHNVGNPFASCYCDKCGERHYWHYSFDYYEVYEE